MERLAQKLFNVRKGEGTKVFLMLLYSFFAVSAFIIGRIVSTSLFLHRAGIGNLPVMYLLVAVSVASVTWLYNHHGDRLRLDRAIIIVTLLAIAGLLLLWASLVAGLSFAAPVLYIFVEIMGALVIIQFATFLNELFNSREIKRLASVVWAGGVFANLVSFPMKALTAHMAAEHFLLVMVAALGLCVLIVSFLAGQNRGMLEYAQNSRHLLAAHAKGFGNGGVVTDSHRKAFDKLRVSISVLIAISMIGITLVDYQFKATSRFAFPSETDLTEFLFAMYAYAGVASIIVQFLFFGKLLERFGILVTLLVLPATLMLGAVGSVALLVSWAVWMTRGGEIILRYTITDPTVKMLYQPLPPAVRRRAQAVDGGMVRAGAQAVGALGVILLTTLHPVRGLDDALALGLPLGIVLLAWAAAMFPAYRAYVRALLVSGRRTRQDASESIREDIPSAVVRRGLSSMDPLQVINTLELLEHDTRSRVGQWHQMVLDALRAYLADPQDPQRSAAHHALVRQAMVRFLGGSDNRGYAVELLPLFNDSDDAVAAEAIGAYCALEHERATRAIAPFLTHPTATVRAASIAGLITYGGLDGVLSSAAQLRDMLASDDWRQRASAAEVLGLIGIKSFYPSIFQLISDPVVDVRREAIIAAGEMKSQQLVPAVIQGLRHQGTRNAAVKALLRFGDPVLPVLIHVLMEPNTPCQIRQGLVSVLQQHGGQEAADALMALLATAGGSLRLPVVNALVSIRQRHPDILVDVRTIRGELHRELQQFYQQLSDERTASQFLTSPLLAATLKERQQVAMRRVFGLLGMIYPPRMVESIEHDLAGQNPQARANAIEIIDNVFDSETRGILITVLENLSLDEKVERGDRYFGLEQRDLGGLIEHLRGLDDPWVTATLLHALAEARLTMQREVATQYLDHEDPLVRQTAVYALGRLASEADLPALLTRVLRDEEPLVRDYAQSLTPAG